MDGAAYYRLGRAEVAAGRTESRCQGVLVCAVSDRVRMSACVRLATRSPHHLTSCGGTPGHHP